MACTQSPSLVGKGTIRRDGSRREVRFAITEAAAEGGKVKDRKEQLKCK
jgi:hypothetical protein